jgi:3-hydroxy-9,10-secoandrosta-1,3,5(10)-triene-9,17-dione monooxygenase reductase component
MDGMMRIEPAAFRRVLGHLPTGVTVITADHSDGPVGMACNSVTSVSLQPPLISFCPARTSETWPALRAAGRFCVNVMADHHEQATRAFARKDVDRFAGVSHHSRIGGPALDDAVAWLDCEIHAEHDAGDHMIVVARVVAMEARNGAEPLMFFRGTYGTFTPGVAPRHVPVRSDR